MMVEGEREEGDQKLHRQGKIHADFLAYRNFCTSPPAAAAIVHLGSNTSGYVIAW
jgi:hypothetical protein